MGRGLYEDIKVLFVWTLRSVIQVIQLIWKLKKTFALYLFNHLDHGPLIESRVIAGFFQFLGSIGSLVFH